MLKFRQFRSDDLDLVKVLIDRTIDVSYAADYPERARAFFKAYHSLDNITSDARSGLTLVVEDGSAIVATVTLKGSSVLRMFVLPEHQGRGLGKELMMLLEAGAQRVGQLHLELDSSLGARSFYEQLGFMVVEEAFHDLGEGQQLRYFKMVKRLEDQRRSQATSR